MEYTNISIQGDSTNRFVLQKQGENPLIVLGLNPGTTDDVLPNSTINRIMSLAEYNGFDSFVMFNVYPIRAKKPTDLPNVIEFNIHNDNLENIRLAMNKISKCPTVLLAYGNSILIRDYMMFCLGDILTLLNAYSSNFVQVGALTYRGLPPHPLFCPIEAFSKYEIDYDIYDTSVFCNKHKNIPNPYEVVRKEEIVEKDVNTICITTKGYDSRNRVVMHSVEVEGINGTLISSSGIIANRIGVFSGGGTTNHEGNMLNCSFENFPMSE